jgi:hypothetical protein
MKASTRAALIEAIVAEAGVNATLDALIFAVEKRAGAKADNTGTNGYTLFAHALQKTANAVPLDVR